MDFNLEATQENPVLRAATKRSLVNVLSTSEIEVIERKLISGIWMEPQYQRKALIRQSFGMLQHYQELREVEKEVTKYIAEKLEEERSHSSQRDQQRSEKKSDQSVSPKKVQKMSFCYEPKKGERLPKLRTSINPFCHKIEDINHIPGQVITLVLASNKNWMNDYMIDIFNCCQKMLMRNHQVWGSQVRVIGVSHSDARGRLLKDKCGQPIKWTSIEHLELFHEGRTFIDIVAKPHQVTILLLDKQGFVNFIGKIQDIVLENRIREMLVEEQAPKPSEATLQASQSALQESQWGQFKKLIEQVQCTKGLPGDISITLSARRKKKYDFGVVKSEIEPLRIVYSSSSQNNVQEYINLNLITQGLNKNQFIYQEEYNRQNLMRDRSNQLQSKYNKACLALRKNKIQKNPFLFEGISLDILNTAYSHCTRVIQYPRLLYKQQCSFEQSEAVLNDMQQTNESVRTIFFNAPDIMSEFPFKVLGSKFQGIKCLKGTDLCGECNIEHRSGVNLAIIKNFILSEELAQLANNNNFQVHVLGAARQPEAIQIAAKYKNIFIYERNQHNCDLMAYQFYSRKGSHHTRQLVLCFVVNSHGIIVESSSRRQFTQEAVSNWFEQKDLRQQRLLSDPNLAEFFTGLTTSKQTSILRDAIKEWDYTPQVRINYTCESDFHSQDKKQILSARLEVKIRDKHRQFIDYISNIFKKYGLEYDIREIETLDIPDSSFCCDCGELLSYPRYYYPWSQTHRCCNCAEAEDTNQPLLSKRFALSENAIFVRASNTNVDLLRLGSPVQPKLEKDFTSRDRYSNTHKCNLCRQKCSILYACLGCQRFESKLEVCLSCMKILVGTNEQKKARLNVPQRHKDEHPMIRMVSQRMARRYLD